MEYLLALVFTLFKIAIQAGIYATLVGWLLRLVTSQHPTNSLGQATQPSHLLWKCHFVVVYMVLFLFSCTYWGDHGLGDSARLPLGHGEEITELNGTETFFEGRVPFRIADMAGAQQVAKFQVTDEILCGQAEETFYFTYNLATKENLVFADAQEYNAYAAPHGLPASSELTPFWQQYKRYWGGWRFWLLA
jgi:hypothetical protein